jgi:AcrR family transcriptional regulator
LEGVEQVTPTRLPSGRHRLTREAVVASQRGRLIDAVAGAVAAKGYAATTVADIVERAGVSRSTFYEQFDDKEAAFIAAYDVGAEVVLGRLAEAIEGLPEGAGWREMIRTAIATYMRVLADEPAFAWALHVEALSAGPDTHERRAAIFSVFSGRTRWAYDLARREDPSRPELPDEAFRLHTGGMDELVREQLRTRGARALPELVEPAVRATLALLGDR